MQNEHKANHRPVIALIRGSFSEYNILLGKAIHQTAIEYDLHLIHFLSGYEKAGEDIHLTNTSIYDCKHQKIKSKDTTSERNSNTSTSIHKQL